MPCLYTHLFMSVYIYIYMYTYIYIYIYLELYLYVLIGVFVLLPSLPLQGVQPTRAPGFQVNPKMARLEFWGTFLLGSNYQHPSRHPKYRLMETIRPLIKVHWGV